MSAGAAEWETVKEWFHAALERPAVERTSYLEVSLRERPVVLREVRSLLAAHDAGDERFERA